MKQGSGNNTASGQKTEPIPHAINPGGAAQLGTIVIQNPTPLDGGRGYSAPKNKSESSSNCGSQGKY